MLRLKKKLNFVGSFILICHSKEKQSIWIILTELINKNYPECFEIIMDTTINECESHKTILVSSEENFNCNR